VVSSVVGKDLPYDWLRDLAPVSLVTRFAPVLIINPSLPARDLKEFIALAKASPGKFSYGSSGPGTGIHLASELFKVPRASTFCTCPIAAMLASCPTCSPAASTCSMACRRRRRTSGPARSARSA
jgi:hypothetical protein